jgi:hypothetical protein
LSHSSAHSTVETPPGIENPAHFIRFTKTGDTPSASANFRPFFNMPSPFII